MTLSWSGIMFTQIAVLLEKKYMRDYGGPHALAGLRPECIEERLEAIKRVYVLQDLFFVHLALAVPDGHAHHTCFCAS